MSFLLDTNALSEPQGPAPDAGFIAWLNEQTPESLYISALTLGEIRRGVLTLPTGARRAALEAWLAEAQAAFGDRILAIDAKVATAWAEVALAARAEGRVAGAIDELIAATALAHNLTIVTRNRRHFEAGGCTVLSPWADG